MLDAYSTLLTLLWIFFVISVVWVFWIFVFFDQYESRIRLFTYGPMYLFFLLGLTISCGLYFEVSDPIFHYKVVLQNTTASLEVSNTCKTFRCQGDCMPPLENSDGICNKNNPPIIPNEACAINCYEYLKKYAAIKQYKLQNMDNLNRYITVSFKTKPIYDKPEDVTSAVFPNILNTDGYLSTDNSFDNFDQSDNFGKIQWVSLSSYTTEQYVRFLLVIFFAIATVTFLVLVLIRVVKNNNGYNPL